MQYFEKTSRCFVFNLHEQTQPSLRTMEEGFKQNEKQYEHGITSRSSCGHEKASKMPKE